MATRGRPKSPGGPKKSADRKREFDRRMRNADGRFEGEPSRTPVVLYLSAQAREVIRRHREEAALADVTPLLDSKLVEALLVAFQSKRTAETSTSIDEAAATVGSASPPPQSETDIQLLRQLREEVRRLGKALESSNADLAKKKEEIGDEENISGERWTAVRRKLLERHYMEASRLMFPMAQRLRKGLDALPSDAARMLAMSEEVMDYLVTLVDILERNPPK